MNIRVAIIDLYNGAENLGMAGIIRLVERFDDLDYEVFDVRAEHETPGLDHDIYIFSGGPGDPRELDPVWSPMFADLLDRLWQFNEANPGEAKQVLNICHSFQMVCQHFGVAKISKRRSESFGIYPVHKTEAGLAEPLFQKLADPFFIADFRLYQVTKLDVARMEEMGAEVIALEKKRPHVPLERAIMGVRFSPDWVGFQFHPEAHPAGMLEHFYKKQIKKKYVDLRGTEKYSRMIELLGDPNTLEKTHATIIPGFLNAAREKIYSRSNAFVN